MNVNKIVADTNYDELCEAVLKTSHIHNVSRKQAYYMVVDRVKMEFNAWNPYKNYESFKAKFWKWQNGHK